MHDSPMLDKIRKLLAMAEDPAATQAEAEAFTAKAAALVAKYGIDAALLAVRNPTSETAERLTVSVDAPFARDKAQLVGWVAQALRCKTVTVSGGSRIAVNIFGFRSDLDRVELLYTSLLMQAANAMTATLVPYGVNRAAWRRSWYHGYALAVYWRLKRAESRAEHAAQAARPADAGPSVALVLIDRSALVDQAMTAAFPKLGKGRKRHLSGSGNRDGYTAGQRANLGGTAVTATRPTTAIGA